MTESGSLQVSGPNPVQARRRRLLVGVAGVAAVSGFGWAWRRYQPEVMAGKVESSLWRQQFMTPEGGSMTLASLQGRPLVLNFWATWCPPCVEELPLLSTFFQENSSKGWHVVGLAVDQLDPVRHFLRKYPVAFPVVLAGTAGVALGRSFGNVGGGLPFTVVLGSDGLVAHRKIGKVKPDDLQAWAKLT